MIEDKTDAKRGTHPEQAEPKQLDQFEQQGQTNAADQPGRCVTPPRRPLFRHERANGRN
jgi:hypothetical protein